MAKYLWILVPLATCLGLSFCFASASTEGAPVEADLKYLSNVWLRMAVVGGLWGLGCMAAYDLFALWDKWSKRRLFRRDLHQRR